MMYAKIKIGSLLACVVLVVVACQNAPIHLQTATCAGQQPGNCSGNNSVTATINIDASGDIVSVTPDPVNVCRNGKVTFKSSDGDEFGIVFSPNSGGKVDLNQDVWSSGGEHKVKVKNLAQGACVEYTVIRKAGGGVLKYLDPILIIDK